MLTTNLGRSLAAVCVVVAVLLPGEGALGLSRAAHQRGCDTEEFDYCLPSGTNPTVPEGTNPRVPWGVSIQDFPYGRH